jgi:4-diphosphocytidyl-2-C-methyl-D-erythritol kinase
VIAETAPAKVNLVLHVGQQRADGLHELCSLFASVDLADHVTVQQAEGDEIVCAGVDGPNLAARALDVLRERIHVPPLRVEIEKRIPVAAGLGGGSADAAAVLRAANAIAGGSLDADELRELAMRIGADVPSQVEPRSALVTGAGEHVQPIALPPYALVLWPDPEGLATADVYREADRIGATRPQLDPRWVRWLESAPLEDLAAAVENDLEAAAVSLRPALRERIEALRETGALAASVSGSGPTVFGLFPERAAAESAAARVPGGVVTIVRA